MLLTLCVASLFLQTHEKPITVFCYSQEPNSEVSKLLESSPKVLLSKAQSVGLQTLKIGIDSVVFTTNLWNIEEFQRKIDGIVALVALGAKGQGTVKVSELSARDREGVWALIKRGAVGQELASAWNEPGLVLVLKRQDRVNLSLEGKEQSVLVEKPGATPSAKIAVPPLQPGKSTVQAELKKKDRGEELNFKFIERGSAQANLRLIRAFSDYLDKLIQKQDDDYLDGRAKLLAAFPGDGFSKGGTLAGAPKLLDTLLDGFVSSATSRTFKTADEARAYLSQAKIGNVESDVFVGFFKNAGSGMTGGFQSTKTSRFGGP